MGKKTPANPQWRMKLRSSGVRAPYASDAYAQRAAMRALRFAASGKESMPRHIYEKALLLAAAGATGE